MKTKSLWFTALGCLGAMTVLAQAPAQAQAPAAPAAPQQGPGVQASNDARYAEWIATKCKTPPPPAPARGGGGAGRGGGANAAAGPPAHNEYTVTEIPGVIAAGQKWKSLWTGTGNNADGIIATSDGGILAAQNTNSTVMKIDRDGKVSLPYRDTNTGGALSMNKMGALFIVQRGLPAAVWQLEPQRRLFADTYNGDPLDCIGGTINDLTADSKGGLYFTMGVFGSSGLFYVNPRGVVTKYGENLSTNGLMLSPDEKTLYVTTRGIVAFDVQADGSLTNQRQFATVGNDGLAVDAAGRLYATTGGGGGAAAAAGAAPAPPAGIQVISADGKVLGAIPTPLNFITVAFSGPDKKTLYGVANNQRFTEIFSIPMLAQGYKDRAK